MRLTPRSTTFSDMAVALSLVVAKYKPVPQLPSASQVQAHGFVASNNLSALIAGDGQTFQVRPVSTPLQNTSEWGQSSVLYIPSTSEADSGSNAQTAHGKSFSQSSDDGTVGPGGCPVQQAYTPLGGWQALPDPLFAPFDPVRANIYRYRQQIGVNLGAWMVQEAWMTPSLFACSIDGKSAEHDIVAGFGATRVGIASATAFMMRHWDTWITEDDFVRMQAMGINTIRIPIGHWSLGPHFARNSTFAEYADVYKSSWHFVARAINWASKYEMGVLLDLHGAYGSQNGQAHSGLSDGNVNFFHAANRELTRTLLVWLAKEIADVTNVIGIELLNEPTNRPSLWKWYTNTMDAMRSASPSAKTLPLYFHDAFSLEEGAAFVANRTDFVVQDNHSYFVFGSSDPSTSAARHTSQIQGSFTTRMTAQSGIARRNLVVGEWSCALAPSSLTDSSDPDKDTQQFCAAQQATYAATASGQMFWAWKMENCKANAGWCLIGSTAKGRYLPAWSDVWGMGSTVSSLFVESSSITTAVLESINALQVPVVASLTNGVVASLIGSSASNSTSSSPAFPSASTNTVGDSSGATATSKSAAPAFPEAAEDRGRVGMVEKQHLLSVGSSAARARAVVLKERRRAAADAVSSSPQNLAASYLGSQLAAARAGYDDGFRTVQIMAASGRLSRLGFDQQYIADSWAARLAQRQDGLHSRDDAAYAKLFARGRKAAEKRVREIVEAAAAQ